MWLLPLFFKELYCFCCLIFDCAYFCYTEVFMVKKYKVTLTGEERQFLYDIVSKGKHNAYKVMLIK
jgi:hypothetical protein